MYVICVCVVVVCGEVFEVVDWVSECVVCVGGFGKCVFGGVVCFRKLFVLGVGVVGV